MISTSVLSKRIPAFVLLLLLDAVALAMMASAQPVDGVEAPAEYQRGIEQRDDPSGTTDEIDAADAQAEEADRPAVRFPASTARRPRRWKRSWSPLAREKRRSRTRRSR